MSKKKKMHQRGNSHKKTEKSGKKLSNSISHRKIYAIIAVSILIVICGAWLWQYLLNSKPENATTAQAQVDSSKLTNQQFAEESSGKPVIHFPEMSHDFGTISQGEKVTHTFVVQNKGDGPLKLIKAKGS